MTYQTDPEEIKAALYLVECAAASAIYTGATAEQVWDATGVGVEEAVNSPAMAARREDEQAA